MTASKYIKMPKDYKKYTVSKDVYVVTDEEIQSELDYFQSNYKLTTEVTDRAAQEGDVVNIDYEGMLMFLFDKFGAAFYCGAFSNFTIVILNMIEKGYTYIYLALALAAMFGMMQRYHRD